MNQPNGKRGIVVETTTGLAWIQTEQLHTIEIGLVRDEKGDGYYELRLEWNLGNNLITKRYYVTHHGAETVRTYIERLRTIE